MGEKPQTDDTAAPRLSDWERLAQSRGPNLLLWMFVSLVAAGVMLYTSPIATSPSVLFLIAVVLLSPVIFLLGWMTGMSTFAGSCQSYRRLHSTWSFTFLLPALLVATIGLGLLGGRYWWLLSFGLAVFGHRKGTQRAWWGAVAPLAFVFRNPPSGISPVAKNDEEALTLAIEAINKELGRRTRSGER